MIQLFVLVLLMDFNIERPKLIYIGDPMCSWCYGISPELEKLQENLKDKVDMEIVMGGLRPYNTETMLDLKSFLDHHWEDVHKASGLPFNHKILDDAEQKYDTEPACRAVVVVRDIDEAKAQTFFHEVQKSFYVENKNLSLAISYQSILECLDLPYDVFEEKFNSDIYKEKVRKDFEKSAELGVKGYPTIMLEHNGKLHLIANGYSKSEKMEKRILGIIGS